MKDLGLWVILFLPILPVRDILQLAGVAPAADDAVGGAGIDDEDGGRRRRTPLRSGLYSYSSENLSYIAAQQGDALRILFEY